MIDLGAGLLRQLPAESAHRATLALAGAMGPLLSAPPSDDPRLAITAFGLSFPNPIGLAAGFDKNAEVPAAMAKFGFGFVECGTVTPRPQAGNLRPRLFRLSEDAAVINRMGFNNDGMAAVARNLRAQGRGLVGINIGASKGQRGSDPRLRMPSPRWRRWRIMWRSMSLRPIRRDCRACGIVTNLPGFWTGCWRRGGGKIPILLKIAPDLDDPRWTRSPTWCGPAASKA